MNKLLSDILRFRQTEVGQYILAGIFVGSIATAASLTLLRTDFRNGLAEQRLAAERSVEHIEQAIDNTLHSYSVISESLAAMLADRPDITQAEFSEVAQSIRAGFPEVLNIAAAPDLVVQYVYPFEPNEQVIGLDYRDDVVTWAAIQRALRYRVPVFSGPRPLVQGGTGLIVRMPVDINDSEAGENGLWGVTAIVVETQALLETINLAEYTRDWKVAIRRVVSGNDLGEVFYGDPDLFGRGAASATLLMEGQEWEIALIPADGWLTAAPNRLTILSLIGLISIIFLAVAASSIRMFFERERARQRLLLAIESIDDGFVLFDADENLVLCNDKYREIHKDHADLFVPGRRFPGILRPSDAPGDLPIGADRKALWIAEQTRHADAPGGVAERHLENDSWLKVSRQPTSDGGLVELCTDITELKNAKLIAEAASEAKTEFLHLVSHELRTPLTIVLGYLAFLARPDKIPANVALRKQLCALADDKETVEQLFDQVHTNYSAIAVRAEASGKHLLALIGDILDLSRIESGEIMLEQDDLPIEDVLGEIREQFTELAADKGLELKVTGENFTVHADRLRLRQILINLVGNAIKFTKSGEIRVWAEATGHEIWFHVEDTGPGILDTDFELIFQRFKQVDTSSSRSEGGVGLGLSICKNLVDLHGGTIQLESEIGVGTRFKFSVPMRDALKSAA